MNKTNQINPTDYCRPGFWKSVKKLEREKPTPFLATDIKTIRKKYQELCSNVPEGEIFYAIKANPDEKILKELKKLGSKYDIASIYELDSVLKLGVDPSRISYGNTIKKASHIAYAYNKGVRLFACDSLDDLAKLALHAPGSKIFFRTLFDGAASADWPLSKKFGARPDKILFLIGKAKDMGLNPYGISFHVGSQQNDPDQWDNAIYQAKNIFSSSESELGVQLDMINIGGGLPAQYSSKIKPIGTYSDTIRKSIRNNFGTKAPRLFIEPGRSLVGDAGVIVSEVVMVSRKSITDSLRWVYLDIGKLGGLIETIDESIKYPIATERTGTPEDVILAGPTCDSIDVLYENHKVKLPLDLKSGDKLYVMSTGAYTQSYCSVNFNGFPPLEQYTI